MAESTTIDLIVKNNIGDTTKDVEGLNSELSTTDETLKEIEKDSDKASKGVKKFGRKGSQEIDKLNKKIRKTKKEVSGLSDGVELGGQVMTEFGETLELVGIGGEELESVLGGVENVMKFSDGLEGIKKASTGFQKFSKGAVSGLSDVKKAIALTGIGLLVVALGTLVTYWDDISEYVSGISSELKDQLEVAEKQVELEQEKLDYIENQENVLKLQGKTEREILEYKQLQLKNVIDASKIALEKLQIIKKAEAEKNYDNLVMQKEYWEVQNQSLEIFLKGMDWVSELFGGAGGYAKQFKEEVIGLADVTKQFDSKEDFVEKMIGSDNDLKEGLKNLNKLENQYAGTQLALNKMDADRGKSRADRRKEILETEQDFQRQLFDIRVEGLKDTFATETAVTMEDFKRRREDILANEKYTAEQKKALVEQLTKAETLALLEITKDYRDKAIQVQREITDERIANIKDESQRERAEINTKYTQLLKI